MSLQHLLEIHPVKLVAGQNQHVIHVRLLDVSQLLPDGVGGSLIPGFFVVGLLCGQDFDEPVAETIKPIRLSNVPMQADGHELRQHVDLVHPTVQAVGNRDIDQAVIPGQWHSRLRAVFCQRKQTSPSTTAEDKADNNC